MARHRGGQVIRIAFLIVAMTIGASLRAQTVSDHVDRISGERTIAYTADGSTDSTRPMVTFQAGFQGEVALPVIHMAFVAGDEGGGVPSARFGRCHGVEWFADGQSLQTAPASYRGRVVDGEMVEMIEQQVGVDWVSSVATAQAVRFRVCRDEYALSARDLEAFGRIAAKLRGASYSRSGERPAASPASAQPVVEYKGMNWRPQHPGTLFPKRK